MWPFRSKERQPWIEEALQKAHIVVLDLSRRIETLEITLGNLAEGISTAKAIERRIGSLELAFRQWTQAFQEDIARQTAAIEVIRGQANGPRGGRPRNEEREQERQLLELGRRVAAQVATPEGRAALVAEINAGPAVDPTGNVQWNPRSSNGSPV